MSGRLLITLVLLAGCQASNPDDPKPLDFARPRMDASVGGDAAGPLLPPTLAPTPTTTYWDAVPLHGKGPPGGTILITSDMTGSYTAPVAANGDFCRDVPLTQSAVNRIAVQALGPDGELSDAVQLEIEQRGSAPPPPSGVEARNAAKGSAVQTSVTVVAGALADMVDDDPSTWVHLKNAVFSSDWVWLTFPLLKEKVVNLHVSSRPDCPLQDYALIVSSKDTPPDPSEYDPAGDANWEKIPITISKTGEDDAVFAPKEVSHVGILFNSDDCPSFNIGHHHVIEVKAMTQAMQAPPPLRAPSCGGGG